MATSLAEQLKRLEQPQTAVFGQDKKKASLLFDPKEAAGLRKETVYQIGIDGLKELILKDDSFTEFENTLFNVTSKDIVRSVKNKEFNRMLDEQIKKFLLKLSPYFLLNCTHKALEWLIHRFNIHEYNRDDMLMLILPYHESTIFIRVIQLLKFREHNDKFYFLKCLQKPGVHLTKNALLEHAASDISFLKCVSDFIISLIKIHENPSQLTVAFNFYCTVFTGAIEYSKGVSESQMVNMLPCLLKGISSMIPDFCAASYVIIARLMVGTKLTDKILDKFVMKVAKCNVPNLKTEAVLLLLIIYQSQKQYKTLSTQVVTCLVELDGLPKILQNLDKRGSHIYPFLELFVKSIVEAVMNNNEDKCKACLTKIISFIKLDAAFVGDFIYMILDSMEEKGECSEECKDWFSKLVKTLETQYPEQVDKEIYKILSMKETSPLSHRKKYLNILLKESVGNKAARFQLFEKLHHPNPQIRAEGVKQIKRNFKKLKDSDKTLMKSSFVERLYDDDIEVVKAALDIIKAIPLISTEEMKKHLVLLVYKCENVKEFRALSGPLLKVLSSICSNRDWILLPLLYSYFTTHSSDDQSKLLKALTNSPFVNGNVFVKVNELKAANGTQELVPAFVRSLNENTSLPIFKEFFESVKATSTVEIDAYGKYLTMVVLSHLLPDNAEIELVYQVIEIFIGYLKTTDLNNTVESSNKFTSKQLDSEGNEIVLENVQSKKFGLGTFLIYLNNIIVKTKFPELNLSCYDFLEDGTLVRFLSTVSCFLFKRYTLSKYYLETFLNKICNSMESKVQFILNLSVSENVRLGKKFQEHCLKVLIDIIWLKENCQQLINFTSLSVPYLLVLLSADNEKIRENAFNAITIMITYSGTDNQKCYLPLLKGLICHKEEILLDASQLPLVIFNLFDLNNKKDIDPALLHCLDKLVQICCDEATPIYLQNGLMKLLCFVNNNEIFNKTSELALRILQKQKSEFDKNESSIIERNIVRLDTSVAGEVDCASPAWKFIESALRNDKSELCLDEEKTHPSVLLLNHIDKYTFSKFPKEVETKLLESIIEISTLTQNPKTVSAASQMFKHIDLDAGVIVDVFVKMRDVQSPKEDVSKKKRRISIVPSVDILDTVEWRKGIATLEFLQDKKKIHNVDKLLSILFEVLKKCLDFDEQVAVEYTKQLLLSSILLCCSKLEKGNLERSIFNMELVVQCIRASQNPQTHHHALLVLAEAASLVPHEVLHHIMAVFTFMGSSVLRYDDSYSFQILSKIIDLIIPILVDDNSFSKIGQVLHVFVDALLDVPEHRRMPLYKELLTKLDAKENLYLFLLLVFETYVSRNTQAKKSDGDDITRLLKISSNLCREFPPDVVIFTCNKLIEYLKTLPDEKDDDYMEVDSETVTFNIAAHTAKEFRHYKFIIVTFISSLLASKEFVTQVAELPDQDIMEMKPLYETVIVNILTYVQSTSKILEENRNTPQTKYWETIMQHCVNILGSLIALLTSKMFLLVIKGLMVYSLGIVRKKALDLLNLKLQEDSSFFSSSDDSEMFAIIQQLLSIVEKVNENLDEEQEILIQTALFSLILLVQLLGKKNVSEFRKILEYIVGLLKASKSKNSILGTLILCLAEMCAVLGAHSIPSLPNFMPIILKVLKQQRQESSPSSLLLKVLTALDKILETLALFMSPYLVKLLCELSLLMSRYCSDKDEQKSHPVILTNIKQKIGSSVPPRLLIPAIQECYSTLLEKNCFNSVGAILDILAECLSHLKGDDIVPYIPQLTAFFTNAVQFRGEGKASFEDENMVERHVIGALNILVLKLSETSFKKLYNQLYNWACMTQAKTERVITFYSLSSQISESLKGLFVLFAGHVLTHGAKMLDACNTLKNEELYFASEEKNILLLDNVLKTFRNVFLYDNHKFVNKSRFEMLMQPLVDQLENSLGGIEVLEKRCQDLVTPCIVAFTVATSDDSLWKQLNYQILLKMRHASPNIRMIALHCLTETVKKLGDNFLPLLPESIPFLAELLEDEEELVEKATQKSIQEMEKVLGESLQKYL